MYQPPRRRLVAGIPAALLAAAAGPVVAQDAAFPARPVRIVTGSPPGGSIDAITRLLAERLGAHWGQPAVVESRAGASQLIAAETVAKAKPDGYTLLVATSTPLIQVKFVQKSVPVDARRDFTPLTVLGVGAIALVAPKDAPFGSVTELADYGRRTGKSLPYGTWGNGSGAHLIGEGLRAHTKVDLVHVAYRGEAAELNDLYGGALEITFVTQATAKAHSDAGKVKVLGVSGPTRDPLLPDVPTFKEQGVPGLDVIGWAGVFAPSGTPPALVERISGDMQQVLKDPAVQALFLKQGFTAAGSSPAQFRELFDADEARWTALAKLANLKPE